MTISSSFPIQTKQHTFTFTPDHDNSSTTTTITLSGGAGQHTTSWQILLQQQKAFGHVVTVERPDSQADDLDEAPGTAFVEGRGVATVHLGPRDEPALLAFTSFLFDALQKAMPQGATPPLKKCTFMVAVQACLFQQHRAYWLAAADGIAAAYASDALVVPVQSILSTKQKETPAGDSLLVGGIGR